MLLTIIVAHHHDKIKNYNFLLVEQEQKLLAVL